MGIAETRPPSGVEVNRSTDREAATREEEQLDVVGNANNVLRTLWVMQIWHWRQVHGELVRVDIEPRMEWVAALRTELLRQ